MQLHQKTLIQYYITWSVFGMTVRGLLKAHHSLNSTAISLCVWRRIWRRKCCCLWGEKLDSDMNFSMTMRRRASTTGSRWKFASRNQQQYHQGTNPWTATWVEGIDVYHRMLEETRHNIHRAVIGLGPYRLADQCKNFKVDPVLMANHVSWSEG